MIEILILLFSILIMSNSSKKIACFCYGSNSVTQLCERVGNSHLVAVKALLPNYTRIFGGYSNRWKGAVASILEKDGEECKGSICYLSEEEMTKLDRFEGIDEGNDPWSSDASKNVYCRKKIAVNIYDDKSNTWQTISDAIAYIKNDSQYTEAPSIQYLTACENNIGKFWNELDNENTILVKDDRGLLRGKFKKSKLEIIELN